MTIKNAKTRRVKEVKTGITWGSSRFGLGYILHIMEDGSTYCMRVLCLGTKITIGLHITGLTDVAIEQ